MKERIVQAIKNAKIIAKSEAKRMEDELKMKYPNKVWGRDYFDECGSAYLIVKKQRKFQNALKKIEDPDITIRKGVYGGLEISIYGITKSQCISIRERIAEVFKDELSEFGIVEVKKY